MQSENEGSLEVYTYNPGSGLPSIKFDLSGFKDPAAQGRVAQAIDALATVADTSGGFARTALQSIAGHTIYYTDDPSTYQTAVGVPPGGAIGMDGQLGGETGSAQGSPYRNFIYINPNGNTQMSSADPALTFSSIVGATVHETLHTTGLDHETADGNDPTLPAQTQTGTGPYVQGSAWSDILHNIAANMPATLYDPGTVQSAQLKAANWSYNDTISSDQDGTEIAQGTTVSDSPNLPTFAEYLVRKFQQNDGTTTFSSDQDIKIAESGQILSDASSYGLSEAKTTEAVNLYNVGGTTEGSVELTYNGGTGSNSAISVSNVGNRIEISGGDGVAVRVDGSSATINLGNDVNLTDNTSGSIDTTGGNSQVNIYGDGTQLTTGAGCTDGIHCVGDVLNTSDSTVNVDGSDSTATIDGSGNNIGATAGSQLTLEGTGAAGETVTGTGTDVTLEGSTYVNLFGSNDAVTLTSGDTLGAYGGDNTVTTGAGNLVYVSGTGSLFDTVNATGDAAGGTTVTGQPTGVYLDNNAQANLFGANDSVQLGSGDSLGAYGGGNTVNVNADDDVYVSQTNGAFDALTGSNDVGGLLTA